MAWLLAALLGGYFFVNSQATPEKASQLARAALVKKYPEAQIKVAIEGKSGADVMKGRFRSIRVEMTHLKLDNLPFKSGNAKKTGRAGQIEILLHDFEWNGLPIDYGNFRFTDVRYDLKAMKATGELRLVSCGASNFSLKVNELALQRLVGGKLKDVPDAHLQLEDGQFHFSGEKTLMGLVVPFEMFAAPTGHGSEMHLEQSKVLVGGATLPAVATNALLRDVNPVFVFDAKNEWPFRVELEQVSANKGVLEMSGSLPLKMEKTAQRPETKPRS